MTRKKTGLGILLAFLSGCCWGLSGTCGSYLFTYHGVVASWLVPIRLTVAGGILLLWMLCRERKEIFRPWRSRRDAVRLILFALFGITACQYSYFITIQLSNAAIATVLQYLAPALVLVYTCLLEKLPPKAYELAALCCSLGGVLLLATHGNPTVLAISPAALAWGLFSAVMMLIYTVQPGHLLARYSTLLILGWAMLLGGVLLVAGLRPWRFAVAVNRQVVLAMAVIILLGTIFSFSAYLKSILLIGPSWASLVACVEPLAATVLSVVWLKVEFHPIDLLGFALVIATPVLLALLGGKKGAEDA